MRAVHTNVGRHYPPQGPGSGEKDAVQILLVNFFSTVSCSQTQEFQAYGLPDSDWIVVPSFRDSPDCRYSVWDFWDSINILSISHKKSFICPYTQPLLLWENVASVGDSQQGNKIKHKMISNTDKTLEKKQQQVRRKEGESACIGMKGVHFPLDSNGSFTGRHLRTKMNDS